MDAASAVFGEKGFHGTQVGEIAARAEVSLATVYSMFDGKEELFQAAIETTAEAIRAEVEGKVAGVPDSRERILQLIDSLFSCFEQNRDLLRIYSRGTQGLPWKIRQEMGESAQQIFHGFSSWVIRLAEQAAADGHLPGIEPQVFALSLIGSVNTVATHMVETTPDRALSDLTPAVRAVFARILDPGGTGS